MAVVYANEGTKNNRLKMVFLAGAVTPAAGKSVDSGAGVGNLIIGLSTLAGSTTGVIVTIPLPKPSVSIASHIATLLGVPLSANSVATGGTAGTTPYTAAKAEFRTSTGGVVINGLTVGTTGSDINLSTVTIAENSPITITLGTITHG